MPGDIRRDRADESRDADRLLCAHDLVRDLGEISADHLMEDDVLIERDDVRYPREVPRRFDRRHVLPSYRGRWHAVTSRFLW